MRISLLSALSKSMPAGAALLLLALSASPSRAQGDPPFQAGRLSFVSGAVSIQPVGLDDWGQAYQNLPVGPGDRIFTDSGGRAEIEVGQTFIRIGPNSDVSFVEDSPTGISIGVAQGSVHVRSIALWPGQSFHANTPSGSGALVRPGEIRVDVFPDQQAALFTDIGPYAAIFGAGGFAQDIQQGQAIELIGSNPVYPQWLEAASPDDLDYWSRQRDQQIANSASYRFVSREIAGADELDANGTWVTDTTYGPIWFPNVQPGWAPYHYGRWINHAPWGSVWVEDEPWGYAPFHYGRWVALGGRWGWLPGPPAEHPVWSPALVAFAGGIQVGGVGVSAWIPLGPGEPYRPWYPCSPAYIDRVNISNMREGAHVHILTTYVGFNFGGIAFSNRSNGITAISQADFAAGRPVRQTNVVINNVTVVNNITIIQRPVVEVSTRTIVERAPARPVPVAVARPAVINEKGLVVSSKPGFKPVAAPVKPTPPVRTLPGRKVVAPPPGAKAPPAAAAAPAQPQRTAPNPAIKPETKPTTPATQPVRQNERPAAEPAVKTPEEPAIKPAPQPQASPAIKPAPKPLPEPAMKPAPKPAPQPAAKPGEKPATKPPAKSDKEKKDEKKGDKPEDK
jgi:hypothetical protein